MKQEYSDRRDGNGNQQSALYESETTTEHLFMKTLGFSSDQMMQVKASFWDH